MKDSKHLDKVQYVKDSKILSEQQEQLLSGYILKFLFVSIIFFTFYYQIVMKLRSPQDFFKRVLHE
jgi:hypothetical protein